MLLEGGAGTVSQLAEKSLKRLKHFRELLCVISVSFIDIVMQRDVTIGTAKKSITELSHIVPTLFVFPPFSHFTARIEGIDKNIKIGSIITYRRVIGGFDVDSFF